MFSRSAQIYDAIYAWKDYADEAERLHALIEERAANASTLLDVACGTGMHLAELRRWYDVEGLDLEPRLLAVARGRLPGVALHEADMVDFDLGRTFDVVTCLFSSVGYAGTVERLDAAVAAMARHLAPGGLLVIEPWILAENWLERHVGALFVDQDELKIARLNAHETAGRLSILHLHHLVGTPDGVDYFVERHELGLFTHEEYTASIVAAGLEPEHDPEGLMGRGLYLGVAR